KGGAGDAGGGGAVEGGREWPVAKSVAGSKRISIQKSDTGWIGARARAADALASPLRGTSGIEVGGGTRQAGIGAGDRVIDARARTEHRPGIDLISHSQARSKRERIVLIVLLLINHLAGQRGIRIRRNQARIRSQEAGALHAPVLLLQQVGIVVSQTYLQGDLMGNLPVV